MITKSQKINKTIFIIFFLFLIVATSFFNYKNWNFKTYIYLPFYAYFILECYVHRGSLNINKKERHFSKLVKLLMIIPLLSFISYYANNDLGWRSHPTAIISLFGSITFLTYFVLHALKVNEKTVITLFIVMAICIFWLQVSQQFNPDGAMFGVKRDFTDEVETLSITDFIEVRNGLYRFRISGVMLTIIALCYTWQKFLQKKSIKNILFFTIFAASIYLTLTRQQMFAAICMCVFSVFLMGNSKITTKFKYLFPILMFLAIVYSFRDALFGSLLEQTQDQTEAAETDIRTLAFAYYWNEIVSHPLTFLFGAGVDSSAAATASLSNMYWVDIGFVGQWFAWGIGAIISYIYLLYLLLVKEAGEIPPYVKFFAFMTLVTSLLIFPYRSPTEFFVWSCLLYICDLHINKSPLALNNK